MLSPVWTEEALRGGRVTAGRQAATAWHLRSLCREAGILVVSAVQADAVAEEDKEVQI